MRSPLVLGPRCIAPAAPAIVTTLSGHFYTRLTQAKCHNYKLTIKATKAQNNQLIFILSNNA